MRDLLTAGLTALDLDPAAAPQLDPAVNHVMQFHLAYCTASIVRKCQQQRNVF